MEKKNYKPRLIDNLVEEYLKILAHCVLKAQSGVEKRGLHRFIATARL